MANELHRRAATGPYTSRKRTATKAGEFCGHMITFYKQQGLTGAQAARLLSNNRTTA